MVIYNQSAKFHDCTLSRLLEHIQQHIIRTPELSCVIIVRCTPVRKSAKCFPHDSTYIVYVNVYNKGLYTNTKHLLTLW